MHAAIHAGRLNATPVAKDFPPAIQRALARISGRVGGLANLRKGPRALLAELVRCASSRRPNDPIRVRNLTLAMALECSERTIARLKAELEASGWLRRQQVITRRAGAQVSDIWLTDMAIDALGLAEPDQTSAGKVGQEGARSCLQRQPSVASAYVDSLQSSSKRQPAGLSEEPSHREPAPTSMPEAGSNNGIPEDLKLLAHKGVSKPGIWRLMALATKAGTRLGQVVCVARNGIEKARHPYAYVLRLLRLGRDWGELEARRDALLREGAKRAGGSLLTTLGPDPEVVKQRRLVDEMKASMGSCLFVHESGNYAFKVVAGFVHQAPATRAHESLLSGAWAPLAMAQEFKLALAWKAGRVRQAA